MINTEITQISLLITNHLPKAMTVPVMANWTFNSLPCFIQNLYTWQMSGETFIGLTTLQLFYKTPAAPTFSNVIIAFSGNNINQLLLALNGLGFGLFEAAGTLIFNYTDEWVFSDLILV